MSHVQIKFEFILHRKKLWIFLHLQRFSRKRFKLREIKVSVGLGKPRFQSRGCNSFYKEEGPFSNKLSVHPAMEKILDEFRVLIMKLVFNGFLEEIS